MAYIAKLNGETFFNTANNQSDYLLTSAVVNLPESFTFTIPSVNLFHDSFKKLVDYVDVYRNSELIFCGRVYSITDTFDLQKQVVCESLTAILCDTIHQPIEYSNMTNVQVFTEIINNHNSQLTNDPSKKLNIGTINIPSASCYRKYETVESTSTRISSLVDNFGGHIAIRKESDGLYIDWLQNYAGANQSIDFGENLLDITISQDSADIVTVLLPMGAADDEGNRIVGDLVYASSSNLQKYGYIYGTHIWENVTVKSNLQTKAADYISAVCTERKTINVTAVDLADAGYNVESFRVGQNIKVHSAKHGINDFFKCTQQTLDLLNVANNKLTLGEESANYIKSTYSSTESQRVLIEKIIKSYAPKTAMQSAIDTATALITGNSGGNIILHDSNNDGEPDEILFLDTDSIDTAQSVWRWNMGGLGYSSTGYAGPYSTAITQDGSIVANFITAGTMSANRLRAGVIRAQQGDTYWDLDTGLFHLGDSVDTDKSKTFIYEPVPPYFIGDTWVTEKEPSTAVCNYAVAGMAIVGKDGRIGEGGQIRVCTNTRQAGEYNSSDWSVVTNYIDTDELDEFEDRVRTAEVNIVTNRELIDTKLDNSFKNEQLEVNTTVQQTLNSHAGLIEQKAEKTVVNGLQTTVSSVTAKFDADGSLIELASAREELNGKISDKSKIFRQPPSVPYSVGDIWITTSLDSMNAFTGIAVAGQAVASWGNDIYVSAVARNESSAFNIDDWYKASDYVSEDQLRSTENRIRNAEIAIDAANANIELKASNTVVNDLGTRVNAANIAIDAVKGEIESCVKDTDYNGETIASKITQSPTTVQIDARHINLNGYVTANEHFKIDEHGSVEVSGNALKNHCYTQEDYDRVRDIIMGTVTPTDSDYELYDINNDGRITSLDFLSIRSIINNHIGYYSTETKIIPDTLTDNIVVSNNLGDETIIGPQSVKAQNLKGMRLSLSEPMFKISTVSIGPLTLSGSAYQVYSEEGEKEISATEGYEIVGTSGFSIRPADSSSTAIMCNVWKAYCDVIVNSGSSENRRLVYGVTNTGVSTQTIYVDFYLMEAHTREKFNR